MYTYTISREFLILRAILSWIIIERHLNAMNTLPDMPPDYMHMQF